MEIRIHGDNIVECHRTLLLICAALDVPLPTPCPHGSPLTPTYTLESARHAAGVNITLFPGYGRWTPDILGVVRMRGGCLREAADAIVCKVIDGSESILLALEYCGALPAGNQAWQRNGRALSFARAGIPYFYVAELSGFELDADRRQKAARLPNPAVPFSYLLLTHDAPAPAIPVFVRSPGASEEAVQAQLPFYGERDLVAIMRCMLEGEDIGPVRTSLEQKVLGLSTLLASQRQRADTMPASSWPKAFEHVQEGGSLVDYLVATPPLPWTKTAYIDGLTPTAKTLMAITAGLARGLTSKSLPMCIVTSTERGAFAKQMRSLYPTIAAEFLRWCAKGPDLAICWVMGFKPKGDDARPDRGLPPLCRMLIGDKADMLTVVYGPAPPSTWGALTTSPKDVMERNGLWEAVLMCSDALLADASTLPDEKPLTLLKSDWASSVPTPVHEPFAVRPAPNRTGENDVDTVLHLVFSKVAQGDVFEGLCNPPGGDWSGISLLTHDRTTELRWLTLPRVTAIGAKRPDHVFQLFGSFSPPVILAVESKETPRSVEPSIGPMLVKYTHDLFCSPPTVLRAVGGEWEPYTSTTPITKPVIASAAACLVSSADDLSAVAGKAEADIVFGVRVKPGNRSCDLIIRASTGLGRRLADFVLALPTASLSITVKDA
jgi:hypothetical protein